MMKVIEVMEESSQSWEDATQNAVREAGKTVKHIKSAWVKDMSTIIKDNEVAKFRVTLKISFEVER
ncbi:MAG: hypothetical protein Alpg2KO_18970 [Alphaproteobacteria bacterium]